MVQEVVSGEAELQLLALGSAHREVLKQGKVAVPETRSRHGRKDNVALLARCKKLGKAGTVDVLVGFEPLPRIAG